MGITDRPLLDLLHKFGSWISGALSMESWTSGCGDGATCCECRGSVSGAGQGHRCRSCGRVFCRKCMQSTGGPGPDGGAQPRFCRFCYGAIVRHVEAAAAEGCSEKLDPLAPAESFQSRLGNSRLAHLAESQQGSSPPALRCSTCRNYEDEDAEDSGRHFFSPMSEASQDNSDIDATSVSTWNDFYSLKSSPLDSPSRAGDQGDNSPLSAKIDSPDQETPRYLRKSGAESENLSENANDCAYENLAVYRSHESEKVQPPLDFENNSLIWYPPPPEDEDDDVEAGFFGYDDEEDDVGDSSMAFSSTSFNGVDFPSKEKPIDANKEHLRSAVRQHFRALVSQLLEGEGIPVGSENGGEGWLEIVSSLAWQAATFVKPDTNRGGSMDPTNYVKVKCISYGSPSDSTLIKGVVCTKNVKHKRMVSQHRNPKILLLGGSLEYQKVPNRLASINTILKQETDHIKMAVSKIETRRPNVLLVEKSVSSYAQEYLLAKEISLVLNVKRTLLERISRCTGAQIATSIENLASTGLGQCEMFRIEKVSEECSSGSYPSKKSIKTLMFFEGCPRRLGCTVLLNGTCRDELKKVKHVVQYASFAAYHLSLETSFLSDEGASLPNIPLKPPVINPEKLMSSNTYIATSSTSTISSTHQAIADKHQKVGSCSMLGVKCSDVSSLNEDTMEITSEPINSVFSLVDSQVNGDCTVQSISDVSLCGPESFNSGFQCKEPGDPSKFQTDASHEGKVLESSFKEDDDIANNRHLRAAHEQKIMDVDDGNGTPSEYFSTSDNHQSILVSLSSSCAVKGTVCERSQLFRIKFYGSFDKPLGRYLRDDLFDQTSCCRFCKEPAEAHIRCYTHQQGSLTISVRRLPSMKLPGESDGRIWMWHRCLKCEHKDGVPPAVRRVVMSDAAWGLSFGKFLELSFSNHTTANRYASCGHSLQKDCLRFYGFGSMVAFFRYSPVDILSICLPPLLLDFTCDVQQEWVRREASAISTKVEFLYEEVSSALLDIEQRITTSKYESLKTSIHKHILDLRDMSRRERFEYDVLFRPATAENSQPSQVVDILELNRLRHCLLIDSYAWDRRLYLLDSVSKAKSFASKADPQFSEILTRPKLKEWRDESFSKVGSLGNSSKETMIYGTSKKQNETNLQVLECNSNNLVEMDLSIESIEGYVGPAGLNLVSGQCCRGDEDQIGAEDCSDTSFLECIPSPETNLSDKIDLAWTGSSQLLPSPSTGNAETDSVGLFSLMDNLSYRKVISPLRVYSFDSALRFQNRIRGGTSPLHLSSVKSFDASRDFVKDPIQNMRQAYTQRPLRAMRSLSFLPSQTPVFITSTSHMVNEGARLLLPQPGFDNIVIAVYENDPTSIISYAISSQEHGNFVAYKLNQHEGLSENEKISIVGNQMGYSTGITTLAARDSISYLRSDDLQPQCYGSDEPQQFRAGLFLDPKEPHFRISFDDESSFPTDKVKFSVTCYFAKQFDALRKKICPSEMDFIRSLSRCKRWKAQGGKSNVYFAKSLDERFIIKQVTKTELDSFEEFAPEYFKYLIKSINSGSPTCLAKVLGIYQVTIKHLNGGREVKTDLMVMENLFYRRNISRVYDLKGSSRARYNPDTSGNKVMLDLNLVETLRTKPIFLGSKAKRSLERAVWNDTSFLASIDIMDYSLLVGVDEERKELVIGIIDFMRQYTWDKHLETWVKASGILGGPKNASPTVVSPKQYKKRFRKAMSSYFLTVPDHWPS